MRKTIRIFRCKTATQQYGKRLEILMDFTKFCKKSLGIVYLYDIYLVDDRKKYDIKTAAVCFQERKQIFIYVKGRAFSDVLRSLAHEFIHVKQHEEGEKSNHEFVHFHSEIEDEANVLSISLFNAYAEVKGKDLIFEN